jgi:hypothetical protein
LPSLNVPRLFRCLLISFLSKTIIPIISTLQYCRTTHYSIGTLSILEGAILICYKPVVQGTTRKVISPFRKGQYFYFIIVPHKTILSRCSFNSRGGGQYFYNIILPHKTILNRCSFNSRGGTILLLYNMAMQGTTQLVLFHSVGGNYTLQYCRTGHYLYVLSTQEE